MKRFLHHARVGLCVTAFGLAIFASTGDCEGHFLSRQAYFFGCIAVACLAALRLHTLGYFRNITKK